MKGRKRGWEVKAMRKERRDVGSFDLLLFDGGSTFHDGMNNGMVDALGCKPHSECKAQALIKRKKRVKSGHTPSFQKTVQRLPS